MRSIDICIISGIRRLDWILENGRERILVSVPWPVEQASSYMRTSTHGPRTTDHGAGRAGLVIHSNRKRRQSKGVYYRENKERNLEIGPASLQGLMES